MTQWQPIETAPIDGAFLGLCAHGGPKGYGVIVGVKYDITSKGGDWVLDEWSGRSSRCTHWMPLPEAPQ